MSKTYIPLKELEIYQLARQLSKIAWSIYERLEWQDKKIMGDQFIESVDSVGANIAEGYTRYHYLDKVKFYYYSRGSLAESCHHWLELLLERGKISSELYSSIKAIQKPLEIKLNNTITVTKNSQQGLNNSDRI
jgi:four helix bundle protein